MEKINVAINGYGRIGRNILRALYESGKNAAIRIVAINNLGTLESDIYLTCYDTVHGKFQGTVEASGKNMRVNGDEIQVLAEKDPNKLPWKALGIDVVLECTGQFTSKEKANVHLQSGAKKVIISAPGGNDVPTIVYGINHKTLKSTDTVISNASCTTNCLAPLVKPLHEKIGIVSGLMNTIHSYTNDQVLIDVDHHKPDVRRTRSATHSMIPTKTGAASALGLVLPEMAGKLDGFAIRVPTINVSLVDLTFQSARETNVKEVNQILKEASEQDLKGILEYNTLPLVSVDFNHNPASAIFESSLTKVIGHTVKVLAWYDNEWGFSNRMLDTTQALMQVTES